MSVVKVVFFFNPPLLPEADPIGIDFSFLSLPGLIYLVLTIFDLVPLDLDNIEIFFTFLCFEVFFISTF